jgi:hypothetical protein
MRRFLVTSGFLFSILFAMSVTGLAQSTYGPGNLPNRAPRIDEKVKTVALVVDVYPDENLVKVKDEITNQVVTYKVSANVDISGDKKEFGKKHLTIKDVQKGRRVKLMYYKAAPNLAQEIEILKPKN